MYIQVTIPAAEDKQEALIAVLSDFNPSGFEQKEGELIAFFDAEDLEEAELKNILRQYHFTIETIEEQNWNSVWEQNFEPVVIDHFCAVRAHFHQPVSEVAHEIIITPKMSFGTGHHATTWLMLRQMQDIDFHNKTVFDFGTGTGILAILAEKLSATHVIAIDVDDWSIANAQENIEQNHCHRISVSLSSVIPEQPYDVVLANINRNVILQYQSELIKALKHNGYLLISGLLVTDEPDVVQAFTARGLTIVNRSEKDNWISLLLKTT